MRRSPLAILLALFVLGGCLPDLSRWQVVPATGRDGGIVTPTDGGVVTPNPIDLGTPCPSTHLVVSTFANSSATARLMRLDPSTSTPCRNVELVELQRDFGSNIYDVEYHPDVGQILGIADGVIGLDNEGFPAWRYQPFADSDFAAQWVVAVGSGASTRIGIFWLTSSSSGAGLLLDGQGRLVSAPEIEMPFAGSKYFAAHPDGSGQFLIASSGGPITAYTIADSTTRLGSGDGTVVFDGVDPDFDVLYGSRNHMQSDLTLGVLAMTHRDGVLRWRPGEAAPTALYTCPASCSSYLAATAGANNDVFAVCGASASSDEHLVHMTGGSSCTLLIDGTSLGSHRLVEVVLAHTAL